MNIQTIYTLVNPHEDINTGIQVKYIHSGHKFPVKEEKKYVFSEEELKQHMEEMYYQGRNDATENIYTFKEEFEKFIT